MSDPSIESWKGHAIATLIVLSTVISSLLTQHAQFIAARVSVRVRSGLVGLIYSKCLRMDTTRANRTEKTNDLKGERSAAAGDFENFVASDMQRIQVLFSLLYLLMPLKCIILVKLASRYCELLPDTLTERD